ncbi:hypothetical protein DBR06_SOUSAS5710086, partial [Sousa chinensis]
RGRFVQREDKSSCSVRDNLVGTLLINMIATDPRDGLTVIHILGSERFDGSFR